MANQIDLSIAIASYDHARELTTGAVEIAGVRPTFTQLPVPEMFRRTVKFREWHVSEVSLVKYAMLRASGDYGLVAIPIFPLRMFRHGSIYVRSDRIGSAEDLRGARLGIPEWTNSAGLWGRGVLADMCGIQPAEISWWQGGVDRPGRPGVLDAPALPPDVKLNRIKDRSLEEMLWSGDLEGVIVPTAPESVRASDARGGLIRRLFGDLARAERTYLAYTHCFPIMHTIAIRRDMFDAYPWIAGNLFRSFEIAKRRYFARLLDPSNSWAPIPWVTTYLERLTAEFGSDPWPYGIGPNRESLNAFLRYATDQGLFQTTPSVDDLFVPVETFVDTQS